MNRRVNHYVATGLMLLASAGCNAIFGFDERPLFVESAEDVCLEYCDRIMASCIGDGLQYESPGVCLAACYLLDTGEPGDVNGDSVECRITQLDEADGLEGNDKLDACRRAGFAGLDGNSEPRCADPCVLYCEEIRVVCEAELPASGTEEECQTACNDFVRIDDFVQTNSDMKDRIDSLQCRLWHLANAAENPEPHCGHAAGRNKCNELE